MRPCPCFGDAEGLERGGGGLGTRPRFSHLSVAICSAASAILGIRGTPKEIDGIKTKLKTEQVQVCMLPEP